MNQDKNIPEKLEMYSNKDAETERRMIFIDRLQDIRKNDCKLTQEECAEKLGVSLPTYRSYEQGVKRKDAPYYVYSLAKALNISADYLLGLSNDKHPTYKELTEQTGLNDKSIQVLMELFRQDGGDDNRGVIDFINCFLGNGACSLYFFEGLSSIIQDLYKSAAPDAPFRTFQDHFALSMSEWITDYLNKVVVPTYEQLRKNGSYESPTMEQYLTVIPDKKKKDNQ